MQSIQNKIQHIFNPKPQPLQHYTKEQVAYLLKGLNPQQKEAVKTTQGEVVVMAGAGSGKTRVLTRRIAYLIMHNQIPESNILAVTFTNKASREMKTRINQILGSHHTEVTACTFHALGYHLLRQLIKDFRKLYPKLLKPYTSWFGILTPGPQKTLMKNIIKNDLNKDPKMYDPSYVLSKISKMKNAMITPKEMANAKKGASKWTPNREVTLKAYIKYEADLQSQNQMDFDDLLLMPVLVFQKYPKILNVYQNIFKYVSVDEYQDVNSLQRKLLMQLSGKYHNLFVVGDVNQSIYSWRGSRPQYILNFKKNHPKAKQIIMEQNYRSTKSILNVANSVIAHNKHRTQEKAYTDNPQGHTVQLERASSVKEEANFVALKMKQLHYQKHLPYHDFAVLYRTNAQSRLLEGSLFKFHVPYKILNGTGFYQRKEIKDLIAYLHVLINKKDNASFERIINVPKRHIGKSSVAKLQTFSHMHQVDLYEGALNVEDSKILSTAPKKHILAFAQTLADMRDKVHKLSVKDTIKMVLADTGYVDKLKDDIAKGKHKEIDKNRLQNIKELINAGAEYDSTNPDIPISQRLNHYLAYVALMSDQDTKKDQNKDQSLLMTLHASKGMEFPVVFLVGMSENTLPLAYQGFVENPEEERRLCYVGMTRAEKMLYLSYGIDSFTGYNEPSRFLLEIPSKYIKPATIPKFKPKQPSYDELLKRFNI